MSLLGQKQTYEAQQVMSALPPKADMCSAPTHVRYGPIADISQASLLGFERKQKDRLAAVSLKCDQVFLITRLRVKKVGRFIRQPTQIDSVPNLQPT